ncbi:MAG: hypothetical protein AAFY59_09145 [Pseudomonadota bacterium]
MQDAFVRRLHQFANAMVDGEFAAAASWCDTPLTIVRPNGPVVFETHEAVAADLALSWNPYAEAGIEAVSPHILEFRCYTHGVSIADVEWRFFDHGGQIRNTIFSTYSVRQAEEDLRVSVIIAHNEMRERPSPAPL